jgi:hypothetical protein
VKRCDKNISSQVCLHIRNGQAAPLSSFPPLCPNLAPPLATMFAEGGVKKGCFRAEQRAVDRHRRAYRVPKQVAELREQVVDIGEPNDRDACGSEGSPVLVIQKAGARCQVLRKLVIEHDRFGPCRLSGEARAACGYVVR